MKRMLRPAALVAAALLAATGMALAPVAAGAAPADGGWSPPTAVVEVNSPQGDGCPIESPNGQSLFIASMRGGPDNDIWVAERQGAPGRFGTPTVLPAPINSAGQDFCPTPLNDGSLLFVSDRGGVDAYGTTACGGGDIYIAARVPGTKAWAAPRNLGCAPEGPNSDGWEYGPSLVSTGSTAYLFFSSGGNINVAGSAQQDIFASPVTGPLTFGAPVAVAELNTPAHDVMPNVSRDGKEIVFASTRPGGQGAFDIYTSVRSGSDKGTAGGWAAPVPVAAVNTAGGETRPSLSGDGHRLYFGAAGDIFVSTR